ncbi:MAG: anti-sigma factor [Acetobacteraceae bacterium]
MSDTPDQDPDLLAAEYTLGALDEAEREAARARIGTDPAFGRAVEAWNRRLTPLSRLTEDADPPADLWARIAESTSTATIVPLQAPRRTLRFWQAGAAAALAIAAGLAAFIVVRPAPPQAVAVLTPANGASVLLAYAMPNGDLMVRPAGLLAQVPAGRDMELWALPAGATQPHSMGVLPAAGREMTTMPAMGTRILVSLEPKGGSPTGQPTGPVIYSGQLQRL